MTNIGTVSTIDISMLPILLCVSSLETYCSIAVVPTCGHLYMMLKYFFLKWIKIEGAKRQSDVLQLVLDLDVVELANFHKRYLQLTTLYRF